MPICPKCQHDRGVFVTIDDGDGLVSARQCLGCGEITHVDGDPWEPEDQYSEYADD